VFGRERDKGTPGESRGRKTTGLPRTAHKSAPPRQPGRRTTRGTPMFKSKVSRQGFRARAGAGAALAILLAACQEPAAPRAGLAAHRTSLDESSTATSNITSGDTIPGEYIVTFVTGVADVPAIAGQLVEAHRGTLRFAYSHALRGFAAKLSAEGAEALAHNPNVESIAPDLTIAADDVEKSPPSWGLDR